MSWSSAVAGLALCTGIVYAVRPLKFYENPDADISGTSLINSIKESKYMPKLMNFVACGKGQQIEWNFTDNRGGVYTIYIHKDKLNLGGNDAVMNGDFRVEKFLEWLLSFPD